MSERSILTVKKQNEATADSTTEVLTIDDFCRELKVSRITWYRWHAAGITPRAMKIGQCVRINRSAVIEWRREREIASAKKKRGKGRGLERKIFREGRD